MACSFHIGVLAIASVFKPIPCRTRKKRFTRSENEAQASGWHTTERARFHGGGFFVPDCRIFSHCKFKDSNTFQFPLPGWASVAPKRKLVKAPELLDFEPQI